MIEQMSSGLEHEDTGRLLDWTGELQHRFAGRGPSSEAAAARALLLAWEVLTERARTAQRDPDGALLRVDFWRQVLVPWTPSRPHTLEEIEGFSGPSMRRWSEAALAAPPVTGAGASRRPRAARWHR
jgi:hypothetical protein